MYISGSASVDEQELSDTDDISTLSADAFLKTCLKVGKDYPLGRGICSLPLEPDNHPEQKFDTAEDRKSKNEPDLLLSRC